jgi:quercetin 2,3-dioxygenase
MAESTSRRRMIATSAAALGALGSIGASSRLLVGEEAHMQTEPSTRSTQVRRRVTTVLPPSSKHWVGDGFFVHGVLSPSGNPRVQSPFLMLDHAARRTFAPGEKPRGVGEHPHRGFETVTFAYRGEIEHRDSSGGGGIIGPGDVQWMTAASGVVHEEMHSEKLTREGGELEMVQLWVNLPARAKMSAPGYQALVDGDFPRVSIGAAEARVIAGSVAGATGPARTHTPITIFDLAFGSEGSAEFELPRSYNVMTFNLEGSVRVGEGDRSLNVGELAVLVPQEGSVVVHASAGARVLVLSGEPIDEPVAAYGPFVMNSREELVQAVQDYQSGRMGHLR